MTITPEKNPQKRLAEEERLFLVDMTNHANIHGKALRVELRRLRDPVASKATVYGKKIAEPNYIIGLLETERLPLEGSVFKMPYHSLNGLQHFGVADFREPVTSVAKSEDARYIYFATSRGEWRLELLGAGN